MLLFELAALDGGSFSVSPIRVELTARKPTNVIRIENRSEAEREYQIEPSEWRQSDGVDEYAPTSALIVVPPRFRLKPGASQIVRVGTQLTATANEQAFRIFVQELPVERRGDAMSIQTLLRAGIPVFLLADTYAPRAAGRIRLEAAISGGERTAQLRLFNPNPMHVQIHTLHLEGLQPLALNRYLLPGQSYTFPIPEPLPAGRTEFPMDVLTDQGALHVPIVRLEKHP